MSEYIMEPGARLEIGPHGQPEEQLGLGACCAPCARGALGQASNGSRLPLYLAAAGLVGLLLWTRRGKRRRRNPSSFTRKGERMYRHIKARYGGDPRAKEIAARTVYSARRRGARGLVRRR